jgi:peroxiredoxin
MNRRDLVAVATACVILVAAGALWLAPGGLDRAPEVTLKTLDGGRFELAELRGNPVLVTFWATSCRSCVKEIPHLIALHEEFHAAGLEIFGVAMAYDPPNHVLEFSRSRELPYRIALDIDGEVARAFGDVMLTPTTFLIAPDGRIVVNKVGEFDTDDMQQRISRLLPPS